MYNIYENKTNSDILRNLYVPESILKYDYMSSPGYGLDLLNLLHTYISPEELFQYGKAFGMTKNNLECLKVWLDNNCKLTPVMKFKGHGYNFTKCALFNSCYGITTKIRRYVVEWEPNLTKDGKMVYNDLYWMEDPEIFYESNKAIIIKRNIREVNVIISTSGQHENRKDTYYENYLHCFIYDNGWKRVPQSHSYIKDVLYSIKLAEMLAA